MYALHHHIFNAFDKLKLLVIPSLTSLSTYLKASETLLWFCLKYCYRIMVYKTPFLPGGTNLRGCGIISLWGWSSVGLSYWKLFLPVWFLPWSLLPDLPKCELRLLHAIAIILSQPWFLGASESVGHNKLSNSTLIFLCIMAIHKAANIEN